jgi:hypothetical protein
MKNLISIISTLFLCLMLSSCATILKGNKDVVSFRTNPPGADIIVNDNYIGKTPLMTEINGNRQQRIEFQLDSSKSKIIFIDNHCQAGYVIFDILLTGLIGIVVDAATADWNSLDYDMIYYDFNTKKIELKLSE